MAVLGDRATCAIQSGGTSVRLELESTNDVHDAILVAFDGFHGADTYVLDIPSRRFLSVDDHVSLAQCAGAAIDVGKRVSAADPNCGSPACTVRVSDAAPAAPFPKTLTFTVHCVSVCENGNDVVCPGPIDFITRVSCS